MCLSLLKALFSFKKVEVNEPDTEETPIINEELDDDTTQVEDYEEEVPEVEVEDDDDDVVQCSASYEDNSNEYDWEKFDNLVVCLDNGHGENTPGKRSPYASTGELPALYFREYAWNREIVEMLTEALKQHNIEVFNVCPETKDVSLTTRYKRVNAKRDSDRSKKYLFISIHANAAGGDGKWHNATGWSAYTTVGQNNSDKFADCLYDAAEEILKPLGKKIRTDKSTDGDRDYEANFTVIYGSNMPAVLTENFFQDCVEDVEFLLSDEGKRAIVEIHRRGIIKYAQKYLGM